MTECGMHGQKIKIGGIGVRVQKVCGINDCFLDGLTCGASRHSETGRRNIVQPSGEFPGNTDFFVMG